MVEARGLTKIYPPRGRSGEFRAVDGVDFELERGEAFGFLGPNGAGKSSTMRMISATSPISGGTLRVLGLDPTREGPGIRARIGVVPQDDCLDRELTVRENLTIYGRYFGIKRSVIRARSARPAGVRPARGQGRRAGRVAVRRHAAASDDRALADQRAGDPAPRRADHRARPAGAARAVGPPVPAQAGRRDADPHDALHGRGRAALRPARRDGPRPDRRPRLAAGTDRSACHPRGARVALPRRRAGVVGREDPQRECGQAPWRSAAGSTRCPTGSWSTPTTARPPWRTSTECPSRRSTALVRRATLEDVFLKLTGRSLVD